MYSFPFRCLPGMFMLLALMTSQTVVLGQTKQQIAPGDWHDSSLWFPQGVPTANDSVILVLDCHINPDSTALAKHVHIKGGILDIRRDLVLNKPGRLIIRDAPGQALINEATLIQGGRVTISHASRESLINRGSMDILEMARFIIDSTDHSTSVENHGEISVAGLFEIRNNDGDDVAFEHYDSITITATGTFDIHNIYGMALRSHDTAVIIASGQFKLENTVSTAFWNEGNFFNDMGEATIDTVTTGIRNDGVIFNSGSITIGENSDDGIRNDHEFMNHGWIEINDIASGRSGVANYALFENHGSMKFTEGLGSPMTYQAIINQSLFYNRTDGRIIVDSINGDAILNFDGRFFNEGFIRIRNCNGKGFVNMAGYFENLDSLILSAIVSIGIDNANTDTVINSGFIHLDTILSHGILNEGTWINQDSIVMANIAGYPMDNDGHFDNKESGVVIIADSEVLEVQVAIYNRNTFDQSGQVFISEAVLGLENTATFNNKSELEIHSCSSGVLNTGDLTNSTDASLIIYNIVDSPFESTLGSTFSGEGTIDVQD